MYENDNTDSKDNFPYHSERVVNTFLYPPIRPLTPGASKSMDDLLGLDEPLPSGTLFAAYISIPYCRIRCNSCHCFKGMLPANREKDAFMESYLDCLIRQIDAYASRARYKSGVCGALYIGGGTGSVLSPPQVGKVIQTICNAFDTTSDLEINLEGNPDDYDPEYLAQVKDQGVNRLSIGYQSKHPHILKALNSPHKSEEGLASIENALRIGFKSVNVDLLFSVPTQTEQDWHEDVETLVAFGPQAISIGDYVVFTGSRTEKLINKGVLPSQKGHKTTFSWYSWACDYLYRNGYREQVRGMHAKLGHEQKYIQLSGNQNTEILSFGAGSYSFVNGYQFQTVFNAERYKSNIQEGRFFETDSVSVKASPRNLMERYIMHNFYSSLVDRDHFNATFGTDPLSAFPEIFARLVDYEMVDIDEHTIKLTTLGKKWRRNVYHEFYSPEFQDVSEIVLR